MTEYRRLKIPAATWFFTVNLAQRQGNHLLVAHIERLRHSIRKVEAAHPFTIDAIVVPPDHLHCIWTLPEADADDATRGATGSGLSSCLGDVTGTHSIGRLPATPSDRSCRLPHLSSWKLGVCSRGKPAPGGQSQRTAPRCLFTGSRRGAGVC